jgi:hypothetical protein
VRSIHTSRLLVLSIVTMALGVAFQMAHALFGLGGHRLDAVSDEWVYTAVELLAVAVCATRVVRVREDRWAWGLMTSGRAAT